MRKNDEIYGLLAEFDRSEALLGAVRKATQSGYQEIDAFSPFPLEGLSEAIGFTKDRVPFLTFIGGAFGGCLGYAMQWYANVVDYPINIGGRPLNSWPAFIPITFELTVLGAALSAAFGMLLLNRLPEPYHPVFTQPQFVARASKDRFFLCIQASDPLFEIEQTAELLRKLGSIQVAVVPHEL